VAVIVHDGLDHYAGQSDLQARQGDLLWNTVSGFNSFVTGRGGYGQAVAINDNGTATAGSLGASFAHNYTSGFLGIAILLAPIGTPYFDMRLYDYANQMVQMTFRFYLSSGTIVAYNGDPDVPASMPNDLGSSKPNTFNPYVYNFFELGYVPSNSGSFDIHVNGNSVFSMSGVRTIGTISNLGGLNNWFNGVSWSFANSGGGGVIAAYLDDFYLCDSTTGPGTYPCNTFLGDCATRTLYTAANNSVQWTPLANANWQEVGHTQFPGDSSYNYATTIGYTDLFTFGSLPTDVSVVFSVQVVGAYRKLDASAQTIVQIVKSGSSTFTSATPHVLSLGYTYIVDGTVLDPNTSASWTPTSVNSLIAGYKLNS